MNRTYRLLLLTAILIGLALRLYNLTYHSLWFDEAISVYWARQSTARIVEVGLTLVEDRLPPLYYLALKGWTALAGFSETGVRSLSVFTGMLAVPLTARIGADLFGRRVGLLAAWLAALNPFLIWYAQEARMYSQALLLGLLAVWAGLGLVRASGRRAGLLWLLLLALLATAGLYTHLYTGFLLPALGLWLVIAYPRRRRLWLQFAAAGLLISLAFAPLALATWSFSGEATPGQPLAGLGRRAWWLLQAFTVWKALLPENLRLVVPAVVALFAGAACLRQRQGFCPGQVKRPLLLASLLLVTPFIIASLLLWRNYLAFFGERYFIPMVPWLLLLSAAGAINLTVLLHESIRPEPARRLAGLLLPLALLLVTALPVPGQWSLPAAREAWRQSAAFLARHARPDHAILIHPDWVRYPFQFYFQGPGQTYAAFSHVSAATALDGPLLGVVGDHPVVWLVQSHLDGPDPERRVEQWFAARYPLVTAAYPPGISLTAYAPGYQLQRLPPEATPADIEFEAGLRLVGYQAEPVVSARDELFHPPSGWLHLVLYWTAGRAMAEDLPAYVNLVGPEGIWGASLERSSDALGLFPTSRWAPGEVIVRHDVDVNLNPVTLPGRYRLVVGLKGSPQTFPLVEVEVR